MTAPDGAPPTPLRGLAAWLAAHCRPARAGLIERDPVGIAAYGDIHDFSRAEKERLLNRDPRSGSETRCRTPARRRFASPRGPRASPDVSADPRIAGAGGCRSGCERLRSPRAGARRADAGICGPAPPDRPRRDAVVRRQSAGARRLLPQLRRRGGPPGGRAPTPVRHPSEAQSATSTGRCSGPCSPGCIPRRLPPGEIWNYLLDQPDELIGRYFAVLAARSPREDAGGASSPTCWRPLALRLPGLRPALGAQFLDDLPLRLVARTLECVGDGTPVVPAPRLAPDLCGAVGPGARTCRRIRSGDPDLPRTAPRSPPGALA